MPIITIDVRDGDPTIQESGQHRGTVTATFDDGREVSRNLRAADADAWNDLIAGISAVIQAQMEVRDAEDAIDSGADVVANKEASIAQTCVAYIREAWNAETAHEAWLLYARINTYVLAHSNWNAAKTHLLSAGLEQEEYDQAKAAYQYLSGGGRPATMSDAQTVQAAWESQH